MTRQVEARTLSDEHVGMTVTGPLGQSVEVDAVERDVVGAVVIWPTDLGMPLVLNPTDGVTVTGRRES